MKPELINQTTPIKRHHSFLNELLLIVGVILIILCVILLYQNQQLKQELNTLKSPPANQITTLPSPVESPLANNSITEWQTYSIDQKLTFKYPASLEAKESDKDFILLSPVKRASDLDVYFSIDARLQNNYTDYDKAVISTKQSMTNPIVTNIPNGVKIVGTSGPGYGEGQPMTVALLHLKQGAISFETTLNAAHSDPQVIALFDQILATFKFVDDRQKVDTSSWKSFSSKKSNFIFKYPAEWKAINMPVQTACPVCVEQIDMQIPNVVDIGIGTAGVAIFVQQYPEVKNIEDYRKLYLLNDAAKKTSVLQQLVEKKL